MDNKVLGNKLLALRKKKGLTQADLAKELNVTYQAVSRWENGDNIPDVDTLISISNFYNISLDKLLKHEDVKAKKGEDNQMLAILFVFIFTHILGFVLGLILFEADYETLGLTIMFVLLLSGHFVFNMYYFVNSSKTYFERRVYYSVYIIYITFLIYFIISVIIGESLYVLTDQIFNLIYVLCDFLLLYVILHVVFGLNKILNIIDLTYKEYFVLFHSKNKYIIAVYIIKLILIGTGLGLSGFAPSFYGLISFIIVLYIILRKYEMPIN